MGELARPVMWWVSHDGRPVGYTLRSMSSAEVERVFGSGAVLRPSSAVTLEQAKANLLDAARASGFVQRGSEMFELASR